MVGVGWDRGVVHLMGWVIWRMGQVAGEGRGL